MITLPQIEKELANADDRALHQAEKISALEQDIAELREQIGVGRYPQIAAGDNAIGSVGARRSLMSAAVSKTNEFESQKARKPESKSQRNEN